MANTAKDHPNWRLVAVEPEDLAERLSTWFPYLEEVLDREGPEMLPAMVEIKTRDPESVLVSRKTPRSWPSDRPHRSIRWWAVAPDSSL